MSRILDGRPAADVAERASIRTHLLRCHDERPVLHDRLIERFSSDDDEPRAVARRLEPDAVLALYVREDRRVVLLDGREGRRVGSNEGRAFEGVDLR